MPSSSKKREASNVVFPYSRKVGRLEGDIGRYKREYLRIWGETSSRRPELRDTYPEKQQRAVEKKLFRFIDQAAARLDGYPDDDFKKKEWMEDFVADVKLFSRRFLKMSEVSLDAVLQEDYFRSTQIFIDKAKGFDPEMRIENVYQALRNAWIMNTLQMYLGLRVMFLDSIFAYSMIYPYMDNYVDDASLSLEKKLGMIDRLRSWLEGRNIAPENPNEEKISRLIGMIESEYDRKEFPGVYQSMLSIFNAQLKSLTQQKGYSLPYEADILDLSFEKGGTSVLADGFLVSGVLTDEEADFCFGFGAYLQLADDIQDLVADRKNEHGTLFSLAGEKRRLDDLASRLLNFIATCVECKLDEGKSGHKALKELILRNCSLLILEAIGENKACYSREFVRGMEIYFPIRFARLKKLRKKLHKIFRKHSRRVIDLNLASAFLSTTTSRIFTGK
jgi:hypothetical protein